MKRWKPSLNTFTVTLESRRLPASEWHDGLVTPLYGRASTWCLHRTILAEAAWARHRARPQKHANYRKMRWGANSQTRPLKYLQISYKRSAPSLSARDAYPDECDGRHEPAASAGTPVRRKTWQVRSRVRRTRLLTMEVERGHASAFRPSMCGSIRASIMLSPPLRMSTFQQSASERTTAPLPPKAAARFGMSGSSCLIIPVS